MHPLRTKFKNEIIAEFLPPKRISKKDKVVILCDGLPSIPNKKLLLEHYSQKGFWTFHIRYRGSWESSGKLFSKSPEQDIIDTIDGITQGFESLWHKYFDKPQRFKLNPSQIFLIGGSFGGAGIILASIDSRVTKAIALSPVIDWTKPGPDEPLPPFIKFVEEAFGNGYRVSKTGWNKIKSGKFYSPANETKKIKGEKLLLIHAQDDRICPYALTAKFAKQTNAKLITLAKGGHLSTKLLTTPRFVKIVQKLIKNK